MACQPETGSQVTCLLLTVMSLHEDWGIQCIRGGSVLTSSLKKQNKMFFTYPHNNQVMNYHSEGE